MAAMNLLSKILPPSNIVLDIMVTSKKRAFEQASLLFENHHGISRTAVFQSLISRERLGSTALGHEVAVPHGRIKDLKDPLGAFVRLAEPIRFDASDGRSARLLFFLLVPEHATQIHLDLLAEIARLMSDSHLRHELETQADPLIIHQLLTTSAGGDPHAEYL